MRRDQRQPMMIKTFFIGEKIDNICFKTGVGAIGATDSETQHLFESAKKKNCDSNFANFVFDLHDDHGDIVDTIFLTAEDYTAITGENAMSREEYEKIDSDFWASAENMFCFAGDK